MSGKTEHVIDEHPNKWDVTTMIKVLLALESESPVLDELLKNLIEREPGIKVVGEVFDPIALLVEARRAQPDVVIQEWESAEIPGICSHLFLEFPDVVLIGVPRNGDHFVACRQAISTKKSQTTDVHDLLAEIRQASPALT